MAWADDTQNVDLAVLLPHEGSVSTEWAVNFASLNLPPHLVISESVAAIDLAREMAVEKALDAEVEWIFMIDSDVHVPKDGMLKLYQNGLDIVSGVYMAKKPDPHPAMWRTVDEGGLAPISDWPPGQLVEADAVGLGCCLINADVFRELDKPWFRWTQGYEEHEWDRGEEQSRGIGEDFFFCHKAQKRGFNIYVDTAVECQHEIEGTMDREGFNANFKRKAGDNE